MKVWRLKKGADRRLRQGHPWVFASELAHSAREIEPGEVVELRDAQDHFLAYGYAHPSSQICFRKLSSLSREKDVMSVDFFIRRLRQARELRVQAGWQEFSHRWVYAEADGVPGLIIDAFRHTPSDGQVEWFTVVQASTAGVERALPAVYEAIQILGKEFSPKGVSIVEAPSSRSRQLEGLSVREKRLIGASSADVQMLEATSIDLIDGLQLKCDLLHGQKTGFFLDQQWNAHLLRRLLRTQPNRAFRVLDVCCYVGQWGAHAAQALSSLGREVEVTLVDASADALKLAERNVAAQGEAVQVVPVQADALTWQPDNGQAFDVVICDPPAFVKKKADLEAGLRGYTKLNRDMIKLVRPGGLYVASSCSGLVKAADFSRVMLEASQKAGRSFKQLLAGGHAPDHPLRPEFPEGEYLKCLIGRVDHPF